MCMKMLRKFFIVQLTFQFFSFHHRTRDYDNLLKSFPVICIKSLFSFLLGWTKQKRKLVSDYILLDLLDLYIL